MARISSKGKCNYCNKIFDKSGIWKHLETCKERREILENKKVGKCFHILVEGYKIYWLHIEIPAGANLKSLDSFLRDIWLECCNHLSAFRIDGEIYMSYSGDYKEMNYKLSKILKPGMKFIHEYDFGSTTELKLRVLSEYEGETKGNNVKVIARNEPPELICSRCDKKIAKDICCECGPICKTCSKECDEEMLLPVVNSPRAGVCGYSG